MQTLSMQHDVFQFLLLTERDEPKRWKKNSAAAQHFHQFCQGHGVNPSLNLNASKMKVFPFLNEKCTKKEIDCIKETGSSSEKSNFLSALSPWVVWC